MKLHLGSGDVYLDGWFNVDLESSKADLHHDLRESLPFNDSSIEFIFNEHFIEHITKDEGISFLKECYRVLKNDGVLRISTPNLKFLVISYLSRNLDEWGNLWQPHTPCDMMNEGMRLWGHRFVYDAEELLSALSKSGFGSIKFVKWRESSIEELSSLENRPFHNEIIVEASKNNTTLEIQNSIEDIAQNEDWIDDFENIFINKIQHYEKPILEQIANIQKIETELLKRQRYISSLERKIEHLGVVHNTVCLSWYRKLKAASNKFRYIYKRLQ